MASVRRFPNTWALVFFLFADGVLATVLSDPTRPLDHQIRIEKKSPSWQLQAVFWSESRREAIINGQPLRVGDRIDGLKVESIRRDQVVLRGRDRALTLKLRPSIYTEKHP